MVYKSSILCLLFVALAAANTGFLVGSEENDDYFAKRCALNGFQFQQYNVKTADNYILSLFRIPGESGKPKNTKVAFMQHGILDSADAWIINHPEVAPAFQLVRAGYDVWLGNSRGNKYSRTNTEFNPDKDKEKFFDFSFAEMGQRDLTAAIDYVLKHTGAEKLSYVGHSQGTTQFFYELSTANPELSKRVKAFVGVGPVARLDHCTSGLISILAQQPALVSLSKTLGIYEFFPSNWVTNTAFNALCKAVPGICDLGIRLISDEDTTLNDEEITHEYLGRFPSGTSLKSLDHFAQEIRAHYFEEYDYGTQGNQEHYQQDTPPLIDMNHVKDMPMALFVGTGDRLADVQDNKWLRSALGKNLLLYKEYNMGHLSFMIGKDLSYVQDMIDFFEKHQ